MKTAISFLSVMALSVSAFAAGSEKYICKQTNEGSAAKKTVVLTQLGAQKMEEGKKYLFLLQVFQTGSSQPTLSKKVFAQTEDVQLSFGNGSEKISGFIFLDELNSSSVTIDGEVIQLDCE